MKRTLALALLLLLAPALARSAGPNFFLEGDACVRCHLLGESLGQPNPVLNWKGGVHFRPDSGCVECHGGLKSFSAGLVRGHAGLPGKAEIDGLCGQCHARAQEDVANRVRGEPGQYNCTATCIGCHGYHYVPAAGADFIHAGNCSRCHELTGRVLRQQKAVAEARARIAAVEDDIEYFRSRSLPVASYEKALAGIRDDFTRSFHLNPPETMAESVGKALMPLEELEARMAANSPRDWGLMGVLVLGFLSICFALLSAYQSTVNPKEEEMVDKQVRGRGSKWTMMLTLLIAVAALVLALQQKLSPTEKALASINQTVTRTLVPEVKKAGDRATINSVYEMKRMMVTLDEIKENTRNAEIRSRIDQIKLDMEEISVKLLVHE